MAAIPTTGLRRLNSRPWLQNFRTTPSSFPSPSSSHSFSTVASLSSSSIEDSEETQLKETTKASGSNTSGEEEEKKKKKKTQSYFPKRGQTLELVCETLAFKGKGLCKVADTGFVVMCDRALPGERFLGRVSRKKDNYAEVRRRLL